MGEVWRARDTKLGREVAIKTTPEEFAEDADRLAQYERPNRQTHEKTGEESAVIGDYLLKRLATVFGLFAVLFIFSGSLDGHHSTPLSVDRRIPVTLRGIVTEFALRSPHASLYIDVKDEGGEVLNWALEGGFHSRLHLYRFYPSDLAGRSRSDRCRFSFRYGSPRGPVVLNHSSRREEIRRRAGSGAGTVGGRGPTISCWIFDIVVIYKL